jgi:hypothetical protein
MGLRAGTKNLGTTNRVIHWNNGCLPSQAVSFLAALNLLKSILAGAFEDFVFVTNYIRLALLVQKIFSVFDSAASGNERRSKVFLQDQRNRSAQARLSFRIGRQNAGGRMGE